MSKQNYESPVVELTEMVTESTVLQASGSGLQDYSETPWTWDNEE